MSAHTIDSRISSLRSKIEVERKCIDGAKNMFTQLKDPNAIQQCKLNHFESQKRLDFLCVEMLKLQQRRFQVTGIPVEEEFLDSTMSLDKSVPGRPATMFQSASAYSLDHNNSTGNIDIVGQIPVGSASTSQLQNMRPQSQFIPSAMGSTHSISSIDHEQQLHQQPSGSMWRSASALSQNSISLPRRSAHNMFGSILTTMGIRKPIAENSNFGTHLSHTSLSDLTCITEGLLSVGPIKPATTNFGYLRTNSTITSDKVKFKLDYVQHRLDVEHNIRQATGKMIQSHAHDLNGVDSDHPTYTESVSSMNSKARSELEDTFQAANARIAIFNKAILRYQGLNVDGDNIDKNSTGALKTSNPDLSLPKVNRKILPGKITIIPIETSGLPGKKAFNTDIYLEVRVDGLQKAKTKTTRGKWTDELRVSFDKDAYIELAVCEKNDTLLTVLGFMVSDFLDELSSQEETVISSPKSDGYLNLNAPVPVNHKMTEGIEELLDMEPMGQIWVKLKYGLPDISKKRSITGIQRRGNVKKVVHKQGHKFALVRVYQVLKCASCGDFLMSGRGYQCQTCNFTCHKKCHENVVIDCISQASDEKKNDMDSGISHLVKHRIPHRFEPTSSISVNWCCHCGLMLPIGKKQFLKCSECSSACHKECMALVPSHCGLPLQMMNQLRSIENIERTKRSTLKQAPPKQLIQSKSENDGMGIPLSTSAFSLNDSRPLNQFQKSPSLPNSQLLLPTPTNNFSQLSIDQYAVSPPLPSVPERPPTTDLVKPVTLATEVVLPPAISTPPSTSAFIAAQPLNDQVSTVAAPSPAVLQQERNSIIPDVVPSMKKMLPKDLVIPPHHKQAVDSNVAKPRMDSVMPFRNGLRGVGLDDFNFLAVLGKGNFGKVMLAEEKFTKKHYAIKVLKKEFIIENDEVESTKSEKRVFLTANRERHPFLVNLHSSFQTESRVYFVMEFVSGGDLMWHIQQQHFSEKRARFYACEVLMALEYLHQNNIVYRDLKLDNILLTPAGHIKIADYGLCKENMPQGVTTGTFCGTPEFMAPEILSEKPYTRAVDWWAFGVLIYEMMLGQSPFKGEDEEEIFEAIMHSEINYPSHLARDAVSLLQKLLTKDPSKRLGSGKNDALDIKQHSFFAGVDWESLKHLEIPPPFIPTVKSSTDVSNFDEEFTREMPILTPCTSILSISNQEEFRGFTHISDWAQEIRRKYVENLTGQQ
ncbi:hypothetical protein BDV3_006463 [Batrachochytrium dendrobatidis]